MRFWIELGAGSFFILWALVAITRGILQMRARLKELARNDRLKRRDKDNGDKVA